MENIENVENKYTGIKMDGLLETGDNLISTLDFSEKFIDWVESNSWYFSGGFSPYTEEDLERDEKKIINSIEKKKYRGKRHNSRRGKR